LIAFKSGVFLSANVAIQMEAAAGFSFTFGSFPETMVPRNPPTSPSTTKSGSSSRVKYDLTAQSSITRQVFELEIDDAPIIRRRMIHRSAISSDDLISQIDRVGHSIAKCIQLGENALRRPGDSGSMPFGLHNNSAVYSGSAPSTPQESSCPRSD